MYWDRSKFTNRTLFAPLAYKTTLNTRKYGMEDLARLNSTRDAYVNKPWFRYVFWFGFRSAVIAVCYPLFRPMPPAISAFLTLDRVHVTPCFLHVHES